MQYTWSHAGTPEGEGQGLAPGQQRERYTALSKGLTSSLFRLSLSFLFADVSNMHCICYKVWKCMANIKRRIVRNNVRGNPQNENST
jgi:hypothetical protein